MARLQTTVDSLYIVNGHRQPRALNVHAVEPVASSPQAIAKGSLFVLLELGGDKQARQRCLAWCSTPSKGCLRRGRWNHRWAYRGDPGGASSAGATQRRAPLRGTARRRELRGSARGRVVRRCRRPGHGARGQPQRVDQFPSEIGEDVTPLGGGEAPGIELFRSSIDSSALIIQLASEWVARACGEASDSRGAPDLPASLEYLEGLVPARAIFTAQAISARRGQVDPAPDELEYAEEDTPEAPAADVIVEEEAIALPLAGAALPVEDIAAPGGPAPIEAEPPAGRPQNDRLGRRRNQPSLRDVGRGCWYFWCR